MYSDEYGTMFNLEDFYWWFVGRRKLVGEILRNEAGGNGRLRILDVGCGTGANLQAFVRYGSTIGVDYSKEALDLCSRRNVNAVCLAQAERLPFADDSFDVVTALDLLEHTDEDLVALAEMQRVCKPGGLLIIIVPAYGFLWSEHDEALKHRRRYTAHELRNKLSVSGFDLKRSTYFITALFWPVLALRIYQGLFKNNSVPKTSMRILPRWMNSLLVGILDVERWCLRGMNLPFGVSAVALARKPEKEARPAHRVERASRALAPR
jgi:SAM-dependent methyltransferase